MRGCQRIAVVGSGISGLVAARQLAKKHDVSIIEAAPYIGGHTNTIDVEHAGKNYAVDTGFIVFNDWTYPNFIKMLDQLDVGSQPSDMGFSVRCDETGLEYCGSTLNTLFAQRRNLLRPSFYRMLREIMRFNREAPQLLEDPDETLTLADYLDRGKYSRELIEHYLIPMGAAIWSARPEVMFQFPAAYFVRFFANHGMLSVDERPTWRVVQGGSRSYVKRIIAEFPGTVRCNAPVQSIRRHADRIELQIRGEQAETYDAVVIATHSDTALKMLADPSNREAELLGAIPYQRNEAVLHTDESLMPRRRRAWAAWNYHLGSAAGKPVALTYNMNILQDLSAPVQFLVTLNRSDQIREDKILRRISYDHPVFTREGVDAQTHVDEISGVNRTYYCGAYWGFGFHEDGVKSGLAVAAKFGLERQSAA
ncbi:MAG: NAD(P)/FAD-dependent oxidoreductase [Planctomycetota bacterium]|jgi:predicted NAD/FAD-binding protein